MSSCAQPSAFQVITGWLTRTHGTWRQMSPRARSHIHTHARIFTYELCSRVGTLCDTAARRHDAARHWRSRDDGSHVHAAQQFITMCQPDLPALSDETYLSYRNILTRGVRRSSVHSGQWPLKQQANTDMEPLSHCKGPPLITYAPTAQCV